MTATATVTERGGPATPRWAAASPHRIWASLAAIPDDQRVPGTVPVAIFAGILGTIASIWSVSTGNALDYGDAAAHLTIARRLWDAENPGFTQIGTVWPPLPHLLMLPFTFSQALWSSGAAGAIVGTLCLTATAAAIYRTTARFGFGRAGRLAAILALVVNPSILYLYTTALTEPELLTFMAASLAGFSRWTFSSRELSGGELAIFSGAPAAGAALSRYEGWAFILAGMLLVPIVYRIRTARWRGWWRPFIGFSAAPAAAGIWWLAYNSVVEGDPLSFARGEYSAAALQASAIEQGLVPATGNLGLSLATYNTALWYTAGPAILVIAACGLLFQFGRDRLGRRTLMILLAASTYVVSIISLYLGQTVMWDYHTLPENQWNSRFAASAMLLIALCVGTFIDVLLPAGKQRWRAFRDIVVASLLAALIGQTTWWAYDPWNRSAILAEARVQQQSLAASRAAFTWLSAHYTGGRILVDETSTAYGALPILGLPLKDSIIRSSGDLFDAAIANPVDYAQWVIVQKTAYDEGEASATSTSSDQVGIAMHNQTHFQTQYRLAYSDGTNLVFERIGGSDE